VAVAKAGPTIFSLRNWSEAAYATLAVPDALALALDDDAGGDAEVAELPQPAAASPMNAMASSAPVRTPRFLSGNSIL
jgi:hypothetical protein